MRGPTPYRHGPSPCGLAAPPPDKRAATMVAPPAGLPVPPPLASPRRPCAPLPWAGAPSASPHRCRPGVQRLRPPYVACRPRALRRAPLAAVGVVAGEEDDAINVRKMLIYVLINAESIFLRCWNSFWKILKVVYIFLKNVESTILKCWWIFHKLLNLIFLIVDFRSLVWAAMTVYVVSGN